MSKPSDEYWRERRDEFLQQLTKDEADLSKRLSKVYASEAAKLDRMIAAYYAKYGEASTFEILFSSKSFSDFLTRLDNVGFILEYNNTIVDDITRTTQDIETAKAQNEAYLAQCTALSEELAVNRAAYDERTAELMASQARQYAEKSGALR